MMLRMFVSFQDLQLICGGGWCKFPTGFIKYLKRLLPEKLLNFPIYLEYIGGSTPQAHHNFLPCMSFYPYVIWQEFMDNNLGNIQSSLLPEGFLCVSLQHFSVLEYHLILPVITITYLIPHISSLTEKCLCNQFLIWKIQQMSWIWNWRV